MTAKPQRHTVADRGTLVPQRSSPTDQQLLDAFALGEIAAIGLLLGRYQSFLKNQCRRLTSGNAEDANDLYSLVLLKVCTENPDELRRVRHLGGWLARIAQNKFIDLKRSRHAEDRRNDHLKHLGDVHCHGPRSPEQIVLDGELMRQVQHAFDALPPRLRAAADLRFVRDASYETISEQLGITQVNARKRVQEARRRMEETLRGYLALGGRTHYAMPDGAAMAFPIMEDGMHPHDGWGLDMRGNEA